MPIAASLDQMAAASSLNPSRAPFYSGPLTMLVSYWVNCRSREAALRLKTGEGVKPLLLQVRALYIYTYRPGVYASCVW